MSCPKVVHIAFSLGNTWNTERGGCFLVHTDIKSKLMGIDNRNNKTYSYSI